MLLLPGKFVSARLYLASQGGRLAELPTQAPWLPGRGGATTLAVGGLQASRQGWASVVRNVKGTHMWAWHHLAGTTAPPGQTVLPRLRMPLACHLHASESLCIQAVLGQLTESP